MRPPFLAQPYGPNACLVVLGDALRATPDAALDWLAARIESAPPDDFAEYTRGFASVLLRFHRHVPSTEAVLGWIGPVPDALPDTGAGRQIEVPVRYDGPDLAELAARRGLSTAEVIRRHQASPLRVRCLGFMPGFAYLAGLDPALHTPRRDTPRIRVPAGSVAIGGEHAGIYTVPSPGGWNLIGNTGLRLFDPGAADPHSAFPIRPGDQLRFVETAEAAASPFEPRPWPAPRTPWLRVRATGAVLGVQDTGRPGWSRFGVAPGGALDPGALHWANRLLGNPDDAPVLEFAGGGQSFEALAPTLVAITGADANGEIRSANGSVRPARPWATELLAPGDILTFRGPREGIWTYLAIRGGVAVPRLLGSASFNARASLGVAPRAGDLLAGTVPQAAPAGSEPLRRTDPARLPGRGSSTVRVWPGPQADHFSTEARHALFHSPWRVSPRSDRVGYRLEGAVLAAPPDYLESEPVLPGSIQVPPDGMPIVTMPDGPTVGGYPKIGLVDPRDLWRVAQTAPGRPVRFEPAGWD